ncbi:MAG: AAA family ATPase, partial [Clostridiales bacterium]|nr:AAA family ATPase [Clostridiales bacterium]
YEAINARYKSGKPLIITTNLTFQQLQEEQNLALRRIYDRVIEKCIPLLVKGESRRGEIAGEKRREAMKVLGMG